MWRYMASDEAEREKRDALFCSFVAIGSYNTGVSWKTKTRLKPGGGNRNSRRQKKDQDRRIKKGLLILTVVNNL